MDKLAFKIGEEYWIKEDVGITSVLPDLGKLSTSLLNNVYVLAGVLFLIIFIYGGFTIIVNAGHDRPENIAKGQKAIQAALIGFLIIFASYWIIKIVDTLTGLNILGGGGL